MLMQRVVEVSNTERSMQTLRYEQDTIHLPGLCSAELMKEVKDKHTQEVTLVPTNRFFLVHKEG